MQETLFYCMSNRQLRQIVYACGKSTQYRNKAAAILRLRNKPKQQQASIGGFTLCFSKIHYTCLKIVKSQFTMKRKGEPHNAPYFYKPSYKLDLVEQSTGSLCLQGRSRFFSNYIMSTVCKTPMYKSGKRRINTKPRRDVEELEEVLSSNIEQPVASANDINCKVEQETKVQQAEYSKQNPDSEIVDSSLSKRANTCGLRLAPRDGLKPICALYKIIAGLYHIIIGLPQKLGTPLILIVLYILIFTILRYVNIKLLTHYIAITMIIILFYLIYRLIKIVLCCNDWCYRTVVNYQLYQEGQKFRGVRLVNPDQIRLIENRNVVSFWDD